jgi:hypothetical protein
MVKLPVPPPKVGATPPVKSADLAKPHPTAPDEPSEHITDSTGTMLN